ncbi:hypothetical protein DV736_g4010, partial [Chaetothyriales sp. CBS 134916]
MQKSAPPRSASATTASSLATNQTSVPCHGLLRGLGHVQADCPTLRIAGGAASGRCYQCGTVGHIARNCPTPGAGAPAVRGGRIGFRGGYHGGYGATTTRAAMCYKCGGPNHYARDCQAQAMKCYACGKLGHISRDCTAPNGGPLNAAGKTCYKCGQPGHISKDCPGAEVNAAPAADGVEITAPTAPTAPTVAVN